METRSLKLLVGGPAGEFPANIFEPVKISDKILRANNNKKQADHGLTGGSAFDHDLFPPPLPPPPLIKQYHSLDKGIGKFSQCYGIMHTLVDAVALAKLA